MVLMECRLFSIRSEKKSAFLGPTARPGPNFEPASSLTQSRTPHVSPKSESPTLTPFTAHGSRQAAPPLVAVVAATTAADVPHTLAEHVRVTPWRRPRDSPVPAFRRHSFPRLPGGGGSLPPRPSPPQYGFCFLFFLPPSLRF
jgi:hypothetical protein